MRRNASKAVVRYRRRARQRGLLRLEVQVPRQDAQTVRTVAALLRDAEPLVAERARRELLALAHTAPSLVRLKDLLAAAPLEGIDIERTHDSGRAIDLF